MTTMRVGLIRQALALCRTTQARPLHGLMQEQPLLITSLLEHAAKFHPDTPIVSRDIDDPSTIHSYTFGEASVRCMQLANGLKSMGVERGDRVGTLAYSSYRHVELYYAIPGIEAVCHTINPRLHVDQLAYIINDAEDKLLFVDAPFLELIAQVLRDHKLPSLKGIVVMNDDITSLRSEAADIIHRNGISLNNYETVLSAQSTRFEWPTFDEYTASSMCYTSGTTGLPKGCLFSHRSTVLHTYGACTQDGFGVTHDDSVLSVVPMFHVNGWGLPYAAAMCGAKLVYPGSRLDGESIYELIDRERVTVSAGVPTVWLMLLSYLEKSEKNVPSLQRLVIGGSATPQSLIEAYQKKYGVDIRLSWGMTELSPCGVVGSLKRHIKESQDPAVHMKYNLKPGRAMYGVDMRVVDDQVRPLPHDGITSGKLQVRGPYTIERYWKQSDSALTHDGWFDTGDVATIDPDGYLSITDRAKDIIKSGGEWISSIDIENIAMTHPFVDNSDGPGAAVIAMPHEKYQERPLLIARIKPEHSEDMDEATMKSFLAPKLAKWWVPDKVVFTDTALPLQGTGKVWKLQLRDQYTALLGDSPSK